MKNILVVDDDRMIGEMLQFMFTFKGYNIWAQQYPGEIAKSIHENKIDLVLLDKLLGVVDGVTVCTTLKNNRLTSHVPIIMMSALHRAKTECLEAGADDFITKPFEMNTFFEKVEKVLKQTIEK